MEFPDFFLRSMEFLTLVVDGVGFAILTFTVIKFVIRYVAFELQRVRGHDCARIFQDIRVEFLSHVILAIDFMVVSDVIHSGLEPSRESLITLGIFVLIRSVLAFFLGLDLKDAINELPKEETGT